jgi:hypothetical protein
MTEVALLNAEEMLAGYLTVGPDNLHRIITLVSLASISPFVKVDDKMQAPDPSPELVATQEASSAIYRAAGDLIYRQFGEKVHWLASAGLAVDVLRCLQKHLAQLHTETKGALLGLDSDLDRLLLQGRQEQAAVETRVVHPACEAAALTVLAHAARELEELSRRAQLQIVARSEVYHREPSRHNAKLLLDAHTLPEMIEGNREHASRCLGCLGRLESAVARLEKGEATLLTVVKL